MARPLRIIEPHRLYFVTNRTQQGRLLLTPSPQINDLIGGVLTRALNLFDVEIFAFVFLSNHFHLIVRAAEGQLAPFMSHLQGNIAREVGRLIDWRGAFWERRYSAEPILDDKSFVERLGYLLSNGVKEGLVNKARQWPGMSSLPELTQGVRREFTWLNRTELWRRRQRDPKTSESSCSERYPLQVAVAPCWRGLSAAARQERVLSLVREHEASARAQRGCRPVAGSEAVKRQRPHHRPRRLKCSRRPMCHAATRAARQEYRRQYQEVLAAYRESSNRFRDGDYAVEFPRYCYRPPLPYRTAAA
ncbi:MAG: transposase [Pseudomonadota bacterium]